MAAKTSLPHSIRKAMHDEPDSDNRPVAREKQTVTSLLSAVNEQLSTLESHLEDMRGRMYAEGEDKGEAKDKCTSVESLAWDALRQVEHLNKLAFSILERM